MSSTASWHLANISSRDYFISEDSGTGEFSIFFEKIKLNLGMMIEIALGIFL